VKGLVTTLKFSPPLIIYLIKKGTKIAPFLVDIIVRIHQGQLR